VRPVLEYVLPSDQNRVAGVDIVLQSVGLKSALVILQVPVGIGKKDSLAGTEKFQGEPRVDMGRKLVNRGYPKTQRTSNATPIILCLLRRIIPLIDDPANFPTSRDRDLVLYLTSPVTVLNSPRTKRAIFVLASRCDTMSISRRTASRRRSMTPDSTRMADSMRTLRRRSA
jgi:hypothetical protein